MNPLHLSASLANSNIYEVNLRQYSDAGTIQAFIQQLPRLKDMGVEILWMMPIHPIGLLNRKGISGSYYSIKDFCDVNPEFGTKTDFRSLVEAVHARGMKIIIDWVANHAAWDNVWTKDHPEFFVRDESGNFKSPYDWSDVIQIDHSNKGEQEAMLNAMKFWVNEFDIDGFRADLAHLTPLQFWVNAREALNVLKPGLIWLAETEELNYYEAFDINYAWKWMHDTEDFLKKGEAVFNLVASMQQKRELIPAPALQMYFTSNHDENSWNGTEFEKYGIYTKAFTVFSYAYPGAVPLIYSGQELPNLKRLKFFEKDAIEWTNEIQLHDFYKTLSAFHKNNFPGNACIFFASQRNMLAYRFTNSDRTIIVFLNFDREKLVEDFTGTGIQGNCTNVFSGEQVFINDTMTVELEAGGYLLLTCENK